MAGNETKRKIRLAYLVSHPIQYQAPLLRLIAADPRIDLHVFFCSDLSLKENLDPGFGVTIRWDVPLVEGYSHEFLPAWGSRDRLSFWRPWNHGLLRRLKAGGYDFLWIHGYNRFAHWLAVAAARQLGVKVLIRDEANLICRPRGTAKKLLKAAFFRWLNPRVHRFLAIGSLSRDYYLNYGVDPSRILSVPYAVDNDFFRRRAEESGKAAERLRAELRLAPGRPVLLFCSKMIARKRARDLLEAYIRISSGGTEPEPYLLFVGDGPGRAELESRAQATGWNSIRFTGFKNQTELPAYFRLADLFILPSVEEPWGLIVNEVLNAARPVLVSDQVGCAPDLVRDGVNGFVFRAGNVADLQAKIGLFLGRRQDWDRMGQAGLEIVGRWSFREDLEGLRGALGL